MISEKPSNIAMGYILDFTRLLHERIKRKEKGRLSLHVEKAVINEQLLELKSNFNSYMIRYLKSPTHRIKQTQNLSHDHLLKTHNSNVIFGEKNPTNCSSSALHIYR
jgi:hypothetical protein